MIEKTTYISDDGKEFDNEKDCIEYERKLFEKAFVFSMLDSNFQPTKHFDYCEYIYIPKGTDAKALNQHVMCQYGVECPTSTGYFRYDEYEYNWVDINNEIKFLNTIISKLNEEVEND